MPKKHSKAKPCPTPVKSTSRPSALKTYMAENNYDDWWLALYRIVVEAVEPEDIDRIVTRMMNIEPSKKGGNYCSDIFRAQIEYIYRSDADEKLHRANLLIKDLYTHMAPMSMEHFMYVKLLPLMEATLSEANVKLPALSPKLYWSRKADSELHVFEDMEYSGYEVCDQYEGFNLSAAKMVVEKLANFHAASMIVKHKHAALATQLGDYYWLNNVAFPLFVEYIIDENIKHLVPIVEKWPSYEKIAEKLLKNIGSEFVRKFIAMFEKTASKINVIAHGDLWINNILVKINTDSKNVEDAVFIDYQNCFIGSPAFDLQNLLMTSLQIDVLEKEREFLIRHYFETFTQTLNNSKVHDLGLELPTFEDFEYEMARAEYFTFYALIFAFPQTNLSAELAKDMNSEGFFEPERLTRNRVDMFSNARVLETMKIVLKRLDKAGVLD